MCVIPTFFGGACVLKRGIFAARSFNIHGACILGLSVAMMSEGKSGGMCV